MKILTVTSKEVTGVSYHRQLIPHKHLFENYEGYEFTYCDNLNAVPDDKLKDFEIVSFNRFVDDKETIDRAKSFGAKTILDIDDYWNLPKTHQLHNQYKEFKVEEKTITSLKNIDYVTTTTEHFADKIKQYNTNVTVIPNSIDGNEPQFIPERINYDRLRFGWIGGVFHQQDITLMYEGLKDVWQSVDNSKFQFCLGGYNYPDKLNYIIEVLEKGKIDDRNRKLFEWYKKELADGKDVPDNLIFNNVYNNIPQYDIIEFIFTIGNKYPKDEDYQKYLQEKSQTDLHKMDSQPYKRLWGKSVKHYAEMYNEIDVALVPLIQNNFNSFKSQIKIIEAGWFKKAVIVSNVMPYTIDCTNKNSILVTPNKRNTGWGTAIKSLIHNPSKREDITEALHEYVVENYDMDKVNKIRNQLYKSI